MYVALALCGPYLAIRMNQSGGINLIAKQEGILLVNQKNLQYIRQLYPNIVITCSTSSHPIERGHIAASITSNNEFLPNIPSNNILLTPTIQIAPYQPLYAFLVQTFIASTLSVNLNENVERSAAHLHAVRGELVGEERCLHEIDAVAAALDQAISIQPDLILLSVPAYSDIPIAKDRIRLRAHPDFNRILYGNIQNCPVLCLTGELSKQTELTGILQKLAARLKLDDQALTVP